MNKKWILWIAMVFLTVYSASAITLNNSEAYFSFDNATIIVNNVSDLSGNNHWATNVNTVWNTGILNESRYYDGVADRIDTHNSFFNGGGDFSLNFWINYTTAGLMVVADKAGGTNNNRFSVVINRDELNNPDNGNFAFLTRDTLTARLSPNANPGINDGAWHMITIVYDDTADTGDIWVDGVDVANAGSVRGGNVFQVTQGHRFGRSYLQANDFNGSVDEYSFYTRQLNSSEIVAFWNGGAGFNPYAPPVPPPTNTINLSTARPLNNTQFNINPVDFWVLGNASQNWTCRLYINGAVNLTQQLGIGVNVNCSFQVNMTTGTRYYWIRGNTTVTDVNTSNNTFYFDDVDPVISNTSFINNSIFYAGLGNLTGQWNVTDNFFLYRVTSFIDGVVIDNITEINLTAYPYNLSINISSLLIGWHNLTIQVADGHTAKELGGDYVWWNGLFNDYLQYDFYDGGSVEIQAIDGSFMDSFKTVREKDRYTFSYEPWDDKKSVYSFMVTSTLPLSIANQPNSKIKEWIIMGNHWLDFYIPGTTVEINRVNNHVVRVDVSGIQDANKLEFNSIGDLNVISQFYNFTVTNLTVVYSTAVNELSFQTSTLNISTAGGVTASEASLTWNGTAVTVTKTISANSDFYNTTFFTPGINAPTFATQLVWFYNVTSPINNLTGNLTFNQTVIQIGIDNCSVFTTRAVNITIMDESNDSLIVSNIDGFFTVWVDVISAFREFNLTWAGNSTYGICINNASNNFTTNGQMEYYATGYSTKTYYLNNYTLDNVTDILNLYLTKNTTQVIITVTDENDDPVRDVFIHIQSYDLGTNSYIVTEIVKTDFQGQAFAEMVLFTQWYQFMLVYLSDIVLQTDATKIISPVVNLQINLETPALETWNQANKVTCDITFNNVTNNFRMAFNNPSSNPITATLSVFNATSFSRALMNQTSITAASGVILIGIGASPGNYTFTGQGKIIVNGETFACGSPASVSFGQDYLVWNLEGVFYVILLIIAVSTAFAFGPEISVVATLGTFGIAWYLGMIGLAPGVMATVMILGGIVVYRLAKK